jgi:hypothetical protein
MTVKTNKYLPYHTSDRNIVNNYFAAIKWLKIAGINYGQIYITTWHYKGVCEQFIEHILEGTYPSSDKVFVGVKYVQL